MLELLSNFILASEIFKLDIYDIWYLLGWRKGREGEKREGDEIINNS